MKLVFIHGRDQQESTQETLEKLWLDSLYIGWGEAGLPLPEGLSVTMAFYADVLDELTRALSTPLARGVRLRGDEQAQDDFRGRFLQDIATANGVTDAQIQAFLDEDSTEKGLGSSPWIQALLRAVDQRTALGEAALDRFTRDVYLYLAYPVVSDRITAIVEAAIGDEPCVIVAHSLGSIVAYRALQQLGGRANVVGLVTVGSPLGLNTVREMLTPPALSMPAGVQQWFNAYDPGDAVALYPLDATRWNITPGIENCKKVSNHMANRHGIAGYLDDVAVATWVHQLLVK